MKEQIIIDPRLTFSKTYKLRKAGTGSKTIEVSIPPELIEREARKNNMTVDEFIENFEAVFLFNGLDGTFLKFSRKGVNNEG
jgi:hypothetical protein